MFLKIKQEASGFPENVQTFAEKEAFVKNYKEVQGIELDPECVKHNPGLRLIAKLYLNR